MPRGKYSETRRCRHLFEAPADSIVHLAHCSSPPVLNLTLVIILLSRSSFSLSAKEERSRLEALPEGAGPTGFVGGNRFDGGGGPGRSRVDSWNTGGDDDAMTVIGGNRRAPALHSE